MITLKPAIIQTLMDPSLNLDIDFSRQDWDKIEQVVKVLRPFEEATKMLQFRDASISMVIPIVTTILKSLNDSREDVGVLTMKRSLKKAMEERFKDIETNHHYTVATLLDCKYKGHFFRNATTLEDTKSFVIDKLVQDLRNNEVKYAFIVSLKSQCWQCWSFETSIVSL